MSDRSSSMDSPDADGFRRGLVTPPRGISPNWRRDPDPQTPAAPPTPFSPCARVSSLQYERDCRIATSRALAQAAADLAHKRQAEARSKRCRRVWMVVAVIGAILLGVDVNTSALGRRSGWMASFVFGDVFYAAARGNTLRIQQEFRRGLSAPNARDAHGNNLLHVALAHDMGARVGRFLVQHGSSLDVQNKFGVTAAHVLCETAPLVLVRDLLMAARSADPRFRLTACDWKGRSAFYVWLQRLRHLRAPAPRFLLPVTQLLLDSSDLTCTAAAAPSRVEALVNLMHVLPSLPSPSELGSAGHEEHVRLMAHALSALNSTSLVAQPLAFHTDVLCHMRANRLVSGMVSKKSISGSRTSLLEHALVLTWCTDTHLASVASTLFRFLLTQQHSQKLCARGDTLSESLLSLVRFPRDAERLVEAGVNTNAALPFAWSELSVFSQRVFDVAHSLRSTPGSNREAAREECKVLLYVGSTNFGAIWVCADIAMAFRSLHRGGAKLADSSTLIDSVLFAAGDATRLHRRHTNVVEALLRACSETGHLVRVHAASLSPTHVVLPSHNHSMLPVYWGVWHPSVSLSDDVAEVDPGSVLVKVDTSRSLDVCLSHHAFCGCQAWRPDATLPRDCECRRYQQLYRLQAGTNASTPRAASSFLFIELCSTVHSARPATKEPLVGDVSIVLRTHEV